MPNTPHASDEELMSRYVAGDARAFDALHARYATRLHAFFARSVGSAALADDLVQTTFLKIHGARASYVAGMPVRSWLYAIAARARIDAVRQRARHGLAPADATDALVDAAAGPEVDAHHREAVGALQRALASLPEAQRTVLVLHRFEGLSFSEIAEVLSASEGTKLTEGAARVRAFRAMAALRDAMTRLGVEVEEAS